MPALHRQQAPLTAALVIALLAACAGGGTDSTPTTTITTTTVPGSPTLLSVTASDASATVSFTAPQSNGGSPVIQYTATCTSASQTTRSQTGTASPIMVTGLTNNTAYSCSVSSTNAIGTSVMSAPFTVTPASAASAPSAPLNVAANAGINSATISFSAPQSEGGSAVIQYIATCVAGTATFTGSSSISLVNVSGLTAGVTYSCSVVARNAVGASVPSVSVTVTALAAITPPTAPASVAAVAGNTSVTITFAAPASNGGAAITGYTATCTASGAINTATASASPILVTGLVNGTTYGCSVTATNSAGSGAASSVVLVTPIATTFVPGAPTNLSAIAGSGTAQIAFMPPASDGGSAITSYTVTCNATSSTRTAAGAASPISVSGLTNGSVYSCTVSATNAVGTGAASGVVIVTPAAATSVPGAPSGLVATAGSGAASFSFVSPSSNGGSTITAYAVSCTASGTTKTGSGTASPVTVSGLTNGTAYSCTVAATNAVGTGASSSAVTVTPVAGTGSGNSTTAGVACSLSYNAFNSSAKVNLQSTSSVTCNSTTRTMAGNGVPNHAVTGGSFATPLGAITVNQALTLTPSVVSASGTFQTRGTMGYALNSVKFDPATDGGCTNAATGTGNNQGCVPGGAGPNPTMYPWYLEAIGGAFQFGTDENNAHTQPDGAYHYHGMPENYLTLLGGGASIRLVGFALDGFPVYARYGYSVGTNASSSIAVVKSSWQKKAVADAGRPSTTTFPLGTFTQDYQYVAGSGDLDECNGRFAVTPEFPAGIYHYYITDTFPFIGRCYKGK